MTDSGDLGIADHVWQNKHDEISNTVEKFGTDDWTTLPKGLVTYFQKNYKEGAKKSGPAVVQEDSVVSADDADFCRLKAGTPFVDQNNFRSCFALGE